jgi:hypothetical protein
MFRLVAVMVFVLSLTPQVFGQVENSSMEEVNRIFQLKRIPKVNVVPSEVAGQLAIQGLDQNAEFVEITIRTTSGRKMMRRRYKLDSETITIDISKLFTGEYTLEIAQHDMTTQTHLVITE